MHHVIPENIHTPAPPSLHGGQRVFREEGGPKEGNFRGGGGRLERFFFTGGLSKIGESLINDSFSSSLLSKISVILLLSVIQNNYYYLH